LGILDTGGQGDGISLRQTVTFRTTKESQGSIRHAAPDDSFYAVPQAFSSPSSRQHDQRSCKP